MNGFTVEASGRVEAAGQTAAIYEILNQGGRFIPLGKLGSVRKSCDPRWVLWAAVPARGAGSQTTWHKSVESAVAALPDAGAERGAT